MNADEKQRLTYHFDLGFRDLQLHDLQRSDEADIRMGTFIQAAAFIDALALAYSAGMEKPATSEDKWRRFIEAYFPAEYAPVVTYRGFRCLLLHNFSADETLGFTHNEPDAHLLARADGRLMLDRGSFVAAVTRAFDAFQRDVFADDALGQRVLAWLDRHPPLGFWVPPTLRLPLGGMVAAAALTGSASFASSATAAPSSWQRWSDRPRSQPKMASSIKQKPKKPKSERE